MLDNGVSNHLGYIAPFFLKGLKFLHIFILTISLNRKKGPTFCPYVFGGHFTAFSLWSYAQNSIYVSSLQLGYSTVGCGEMPTQKRLTLEKREWSYFPFY